MPKVQSYNDMTVELMNATPYPAEVVGLALSITMNSDASKDIKPLTFKTAKFLIEAEHTSLLEHVVYTFLIQGVSRSFLAQITRQRTASPTSGSQHYQDYRNYPCAVHPDLVSFPRADEDRSQQLTRIGLDNDFSIYTDLISEGVKPQEARQVLPNAACVNYLWTIDARNLLFFLRQRCCNRNVDEMRIFADKALVLSQEHFSEVFLHAGPQCFMDKKCKQGFLQCDQKNWERI